MIKWDGFGKLLKQGFFTLLISCFILLGNSSVNAGKYQKISLDTFPSIYNGQYQVGFLKGGTLNTSYLGTFKSILALNSNVIFWWGTNGKPYFYSPNFQGFFDGFFACDEITDEHQAITNCSYIPFDGDAKTILKGFFGQVNAGDYAYYSFEDSAGGVNCSYNMKKVNVCFSSHTVGSSVCFKRASCQYGCQGNACLDFCNSEGGCAGTLTDSQNLSNITFASIPSSWIGYAPGHVLYDGSIDGDSQTVSNSSIDGDVMTYGCTNNLAFQWYRANGYKSRMCYSSYLNNSDIFEGAGSVSSFALTGTDILDVRFDTWSYRRYGLTGTDMSYEDWFAYWRKTYEVYKKNSDINNPFVGVPVSLFTLMGNIDSYGLPYSNESILEFCDLSLYSSNELNSPYSGLASNVVCNLSAIEILDIQTQNELNPDNGLPGDGNTNGTVGAVGSSWDGITNRLGYSEKPGSNSSGSSSSGSSSSLSFFQDGTTFENNYFNLVKSSFKFPEGSGKGFLPDYIILFMCGLILFRLLSH